MEVARLNFTKGSRALTSAARKTSCSSGWLRLVLQSIFALLTVASFILIVLMSVKNAKPSPPFRPMVPSRCRVQSCRVHCEDAPYFERYEDDIIHAVMEAHTKCIRVYLELKTPFFTNSTFPNAWLSRLRHEVHVLSIVGGNLMHISSGAFMAQFMGVVKSIIFQDIRIKTFESTSLVGLSSIRSFCIINCQIDGVDQNALRAIDDTLETLTITQSGEWDPTDFTGARGFEKLTIVDFSHNNFGPILHENSFIGLDQTKILYLNFCKITSIGPGAFDHMKSMEVLYLNNNMLSTVPPGLFNIIAALENPRPRINVQSNYWYCDCSIDDLRQLVRKELLLVEAKCTYPEEFNSITFTEFEQTCNTYGTESVSMIGKNNSSNIELSETDIQYNSGIIDINGQNCKSNFKRRSPRLFSPVKFNKCSTKKIKNLNLIQLVERDVKNSNRNKSKWLQFSYIIKTKLYSIVHIRAMKVQKYYGLVWYQSSCANEIYCLDDLPLELKLYGTDTSARYIFCPIHMKNSTIENDDCIDISVEEHIITTDESTNKFNITVYIVTMFLCSCFGAIVVYGLVRQNPTLLKGSKRILFVKNKSVDALVLPSTIPLRDDFIDSKDKEVFTLTSGYNAKLKLPTVQRYTSLRSVKSGSPSYISAMQPTDDQLAEWRMKHHFNDDMSMLSMKSEPPNVCRIDTCYCNSLEKSDKTYESLK